MFRTGRLACPECGSDERTGWQDAEEIDYQSVEIPDYCPDFDTVERRAPTWWWVALALAGVAAVAIAVTW